MRPTIIVVFMLVAFGCVPALSDITVLFSPDGGCDKAIVKLAQEATCTIDACCYSFTLESIANELIAAHRRGVKVRVIVDQVQSHQQSSQARRLVESGIAVTQNLHWGLMHHTFIVVDGQHVATGSFTWSDVATVNNDENLVVLSKEPETAGSFSAQFERMWTDTQRFTAFSLFPGRMWAVTPTAGPARTGSGSGSTPVDTGRSTGPVHVRGYYRKDGTYVRSHYRTRPDGNPSNNYSSRR